METRLRMLLVLAGLPRPAAQVSLQDARGRFLGRPDLYCPGARLGIEYDGATHRESLAADNRRQNACSARASSCCASRPGTSCTTRPRSSRRCAGISPDDSPLLPAPTCVMHEANAVAAG